MESGRLVAVLNLYGNQRTEQFPSHVSGAATLRYFEIDRGRHLG